MGKEKKATGQPTVKKEPFLKVVKKHWMLLLMLAPAVCYVIIFSYIPMTGVILAFEQYQYKGGIYHSPWIGLQNFKSLMIAGKLGMVTRNTLLYNIAFILLGVVFEMGSAILINELTSKYFKKIAQSFMFLPYFISWVVAGAVMYNFFNYERGIVNHVIKAFGGTPFDLYNTPAAWPFILVFLKIWKQTGYGSVVYLAAITGLDQEMFEAAKVDGAGRWAIIKNITIPSILPTYFVMLMLSIANFLNNGMDQYYVFMNSFNKSSIQVLDLYVYNIGMTGKSLSLGTAIGILKSLVSVVLLFIVNTASKKTRGETIV